MYKKIGKRMFDTSVALFLIIIFSPVLLIFSILIYYKIGRPILFCQVRPGYRGQLFKIYKFRSMTNARDSNGCLLPDVQRLTTLGSLIRKISLDELPSLFNVLKGDMSLVGPRPLLEQYMPLYTKQQLRRHDVLPGVTGWAQVNGRNAITWDEKFKRDIWYVENISFFLDIKILFLTILKVIKRADINEKGEATASFFTGSK